MNTPSFPALGLDLATRAGFALRVRRGACLNASGLDTNLISGVLDLSVVTPSAATAKKPASHPGLRFNMYRVFLVDTIERHGVRALYYETPVGGANMGGARARVAVGLEIITLEVASVYGLPVAGFHVNSIKKHATGSGKASKDKQPMISAALEKFPGQNWNAHKPTKKAPWTLDDNQADALHVLDLGLHTDNLL
tara:strand:- start:32082 stop:32666 length:585 start_codon:yes stop_codon:yes gene_type:complete